MILNSLDLRSSASVKSEQSQLQRTEINGMAQLHCSQFQKPLLPDGGGGGGGGNHEEKEAKAWHECDTTAACMRTTLRGSVHHRSHT